MKTNGSDNEQQQLIGSSNSSSEKVEGNSNEPLQSWVQPVSIPAVQNTNPDLLCFTHLRWDFVYQRPQHLLSRAARDRRVFVFEEPVYDEGSRRLEARESDDGVWVLVPHLPRGLQSEIAIDAVLREMLDGFLMARDIESYVVWYYTPMALSFTEHLKPIATVYDCMDELSAFKGASPRLRLREQQLFDLADLVFTGGQSLYEAKRTQHHSVYAFPSSIDSDHFMCARTNLLEPDDQKNIPHPRLGFFGVIDERFDIDLLADLAEKRPDWQFVMIGPVVKIDPDVLPRRANIHYLGSKTYKELPAYLAGWDLALLLFARNEATRLISPTKTPEYLAAGRPVISTSIRDVVRPYGQKSLVRIADRADEFVSAAEDLLSQNAVERAEWLSRVDSFLAGLSWDDTWSRMSSLLDKAAATRGSRAGVRARAAAVNSGTAGLISAG